MEVDRLVAYESISSEALGCLESVRDHLRAGIESGKVCVDDICYPEEGEGEISSHPSAAVPALARKCDAILADDRFFNRRAAISHESSQVPVFSTADLLKTLVSTGVSTVHEEMEYKTVLRQGGYALVAVEVDEVLSHLNASEIEDGRVVETAELKAIRESILLVRMGSSLLVPEESAWLDSLLQVLSEVVAKLWESSTDIPSVRARADWIVGQLDLRGWAHRFGEEGGVSVVKEGRGGLVRALLRPPSGLSGGVRDEFWDWLGERVLVPLKEEDPEAFGCLIEWCRGRIAAVAELNPATQGASDGE